MSTIPQFESASNLAPVALPPANLQELLYQLGDISPERVPTWPAAGHATVKDLIALNEQKESLYELVDGTLVEKAMGFQEGLLSAYISDPEIKLSFSERCRLGASCRTKESKVPASQ